MKNKGLWAFLLGLILFSLIAAKITTNILQIGNGTGEDVSITFDIGAGTSNPVIKWNDTTSLITFANDGSTFYNLFNNPMDSEGDIVKGGASGVATKVDSGAQYTVLKNGAANTPTFGYIDAPSYFTDLAAASSTERGILTASSQTIAGTKFFQDGLYGYGKATYDLAGGPWSLTSTSNDIYIIDQSGDRDFSLPPSGVAQGRVFTIKTLNTVTGDILSIKSSDGDLIFDLNSGLIQLVCIASDGTPTDATDWQILHLYEKTLFETTVQNLNATPPDIRLYLTRTGNGSSTDVVNITSVSRPYTATKINTSDPYTTAALPSRFRHPTYSFGDLYEVVTVNNTTAKLARVNIDEAGILTWQMTDVSAWNTGDTRLNRFSISYSLGDD